jgi:hypothetical protein
MLPGSKVKMKASAAAVHNFQLGFIALRGFFAPLMAGSERIQYAIR